jgi:hypothetical protein
MAPDKQRKKNFTSTMEVAAILCLVEAERKRHGLLATTTEKILFISKLHYPLWLIPWDNKCLVFDGLGNLSANLNYTTLPDLELFLDDMEQVATMRIPYRNALQEHIKTFKDFAAEVSVPIKGLIVDEELLSDISGYVKETLTLKVNVDASIVLAPIRLDQSTVLENMKKVFELLGQVMSDIKGLHYAMRYMNEQMEFHEQMIFREIEQIREIHEEEIAKVNPAIDKNVERLMRERDTGIAKMNKVMEKELSVRLKEKGKRDRELEKLELNMVAYKKRRDIRKRRHDEIGVNKWEHAIRMSQNKISEIENRIHALSNYIEKTRVQRVSDINKLRYTYQELIDRERKKIANIEASRDSMIEAKQKEIEKLRTLSSQMVNSIQRLVKQKEIQVGKLKNIATQLRLEQNTLIGAPFYFIAFQSGEKMRYQAFPPIRVMDSDGIIKQIEKTLLGSRMASRIRIFTKQRSKALNKLFNFTLEEHIKVDKTLHENLYKLGESNNILINPNFKETLMKGIEELKTEDWIRQEEKDALVKTYLQVDPCDS